MPRFGIFRVPLNLINADDAGLRAVMTACVVVSATVVRRADDGWLEMVYGAYSPHFEPADLHATAPEYVCIITRHEPLGQITARAELSKALP